MNYISARFVTCHKCGGSGLYGDDACLYCQGDGEVRIDNQSPLMEIQYLNYDQNNYVDMAIAAKHFAMQYKCVVSVVRVGDISTRWLLYAPELIVRHYLDTCVEWQTLRAELAQIEIGEQMKAHQADLAHENGNRIDEEFENWLGRYGTPYSSP